MWIIKLNSSRLNKLTKSQTIYNLTLRKNNFSCTSNHPSSWLYSWDKLKQPPFKIWSKNLYLKKDWTMTRNCQKLFRLIIRRTEKTKTLPRPTLTHGFMKKPQTTWICCLMEEPTKPLPLISTGKLNHQLNQLSLVAVWLKSTEPNQMRMSVKRWSILGFTSSLMTTLTDFLTVEKKMNQIGTLIPLLKVKNQLGHLGIRPIKLSIRMIVWI